MTTENINYEDMVRALAKPGEEIRKALTAEDCHLNHMGMGVCGEAGELVDAIKKHTIYRKPIDLENVIEELGDLEFFMAGVRQGLNITREQCLDGNKKKLGKRYASLQYSDKDAQERKDKQ